MLKKIPFRRIRWPGWVVLAVIGISFIYGMAHLVEAIRFEPDSGNASPLTIDFKTETKNADTYTMSIKTPKMEDKSIKKPIKDGLTMKRKPFKKSEGKQEAAG